MPNPGMATERQKPLPGRRQMTELPEIPGENDSDTRLAGAFRSAMFWNIANMATSQVFAVGLFVLLTYKLDPIVFGVYALGAVLVDYFNFQAQSAGVDAVVQEQDFSPRTLSSAFWMSMLLFAIAAGTIGLSGRILAQLMHEPGLETVLPALALSLLLVPFGIPPSAILLARHDFKGVALRGILCTLISGLAALATAFGPAPEWALVVQRGVNVVTASAFMMVRARWVPGFVLSLAQATSFLMAATRIFVAQAIGSSYMRVLDLVVGFSFGAAAVGIMRIAARFTDALFSTFAAPIGSLWVVLLSGNRETAQDRSNLLIRLTQMSALICVPVFTGIMLTASDLVEFALDDQYAGAAPVLVSLGASGLLVPLAYFRNHALTAMRQLNLLLVLSVVDIAVVLGAAVLLVPHGVAAVVFSITLMYAVRAVLAVPMLLKSMNVRLKAYLAALLPAYPACAAMVVAVYGVSFLVEDQASYVRLGAKAVTGAAAYAAYLLLVHRQWSASALEMLVSRGQKAEQQTLQA